jgi:endonuclease YncB( thermonuclease family)
MRREPPEDDCGRRPLLPQCRRIPAFGFAVMMGWRGYFLAAFFAAEIAFMSGCIVGARAQQPATAIAAAAPALPCGGEEVGPGHVERVLDGRNFVLKDGRVVHLAGIEVPLLPATAQAHVPPGGAAAKAALAALMMDAQVVLRQAEPKPDRYGRIVAYADMVGRDSSRSVQAELVSGGFARVSGDVGNPDCATELLRRESAARTARAGLWADQYYELLPADDPAGIVAQRGRFALVQGKVVSVHRSGATLYLNFGRHWSQDFAVTIRKPNEGSFAATGISLSGLAGRRVLVRGWIEARDGNEVGAGVGAWRAPWIEAAHPEQIELTDHD